MRTILLALLLVGCRAEAHDDMTGLPNWITKQFSYCCGEEDCKRINQSDVELRQDGILYKPTQELIPYENVKRSQDGEWWRCEILGQNKTRCLFVPGVS